MSSARYQLRECNTQNCVGDEICVATQDLIIALDGSGSIVWPSVDPEFLKTPEKGFEALKVFVTTLLSRYEVEYSGGPAVQIGIVGYGNGELLADGTVAPALNEQALTFNKDAAISAVKSMPYKKGFTNMAQAYSMAESMFMTKGRDETQHALMLITDGKPSFNFMTTEMYEQLDDKGISVMAVVVGDKSAKKAMEKYVSSPW